MASPVRTIDGTSTYVYAPTDPADFNVVNGGSLELGGLINPADTISVASSSSTALSSIKIDDVRDSGESIVFNDGVIDLDGLIGTTSSGSTYSAVDAWNLQNGVLSLTSKGQTVAHYNFTDASPEAGKTANIEISQSGTGTYITEGTQGQQAGAPLLSGNLAQPAAVGNNNPPTGGSPSDYHTPASSAAAAFSETVNGAPGSQQGILYSGPVSGLYYELIVPTPGNINVVTHSAGCFVSTGAGNDAVALYGGTNVVDAGTGSNFLTAGGGFDTFFLDARNIPAASSAAGPVPGAIWDTIQNIVSGDAATIWGVTPGTALDWQKNQGAVGHTGLTLHANMPNGAEASLTLAGIDNKGSVSLSYGNSGGSSYLYVKAV